MMFKSLDKVGSIELLEEKIKCLDEKQGKTSYWLKLSDKCAKMSADQLKFVSTNDKVVEAKSKMMEAFNLFLFEKYKDEFASNEMFTHLCDQYIDTIADVSVEYTENITKTLDENKELKAKIQQLQKELNNAKSDTKRA